MTELQPRPASDSLSDEGYNGNAGEIGSGNSEQGGFRSGDGGGSSGSSGTVSMNITDAKPVLPEPGVENVSITFDEVSVHKSGGGWTTLATATRPYTIDLYQFSNGTRLFLDLPQIVRPLFCFLPAFDDSL